MKALAGIAAAAAMTMAIPVIAVPVLLGVTVATVTCSDPAPSSDESVAASVEASSTARANSPAGGAAGCATVFTGASGVVSASGGPQVISEAAARSLSYVGLRSGFASRCDRLACRAFNYLNSGYASATAHWQAMVSTGHTHPADRCPPTGAFAFWATNHPEGHVAFVVHGDPTCDPNHILLVSNDVGDAATGAHGGVYLVTIAQIENGFVSAAGYRGWSDPVCAGQLLPAATRHPLFR